MPPLFTYNQHMRFSKMSLTLQILRIFGRPRIIGQAFGTVCRLSSVCLSVVCNVLYCDKTVRPSIVGFWERHLIFVRLPGLTYISAIPDTTARQTMT